MTEKTIIATENNIAANANNSDKKDQLAWIKKIKSTEVGAFALGMAGYNLLFGKLKNGEAVSPGAGETEETTETGTAPDPAKMNELIRENAQVATTVNDDMSFDEAFISSRQELGAGNFFWWRGRFYNNYQEEEWNSLSDDDKASFVAQAGNFDKPEMIAEAAVDTKDNQDDNEPADEPAVEDNQISEQNNQQQMEYIDLDNDGKDDAVLINTDEDPQAEVLHGWTDGVEYALVDTGNTGVLDTMWLVDDDGNLHSPVPLADEIPAPKLTREQNMDLIGNDGVIDSLAVDNKGNALADEVYVDMNSDGSYDVAYFDTTGDGRLDKAFSMKDGELLNEITLNEPFESPVVEALTNMMGPGSQQPATHRRFCGDRNDYRTSGWRYVRRHSGDGQRCGHG